MVMASCAIAVNKTDPVRCAIVLPPQAVKIYDDMTKQAHKPLWGFVETLKRSNRLSQHIR
jgi:hypothetical protein